MKTTPLLSAEQVSFAYPQHDMGLTPTDLVVEPGDLWTVTGRSGCGKSTLIRCLNGVVPHLYRGKMEGIVTVGGMNTRSTPLWRLCEVTGMLFQNPAAQCLASSVEQEIRFGLERLGLHQAEEDARTEGALTEFGLAYLRHRRPDSLSSGELQRLMLAAVLARRPQALLLDEPFSMLDTTAATHLAEHLGELTRDGVAVVACEHRADVLRIAGEHHELALHAEHKPVPAEIPLPPTGRVSPPRVDVRALRFGFDGRPLMEGLSLSLDGGEVVALIGRNGVGKTTLLRALAGLHPYEAIR